MRVLHVIWDLGQGGAQTYLKDLVKACLAVNDVSINVLVLTKRGPLSEDVEALGIPVTHLNIRNGRDLYGFVKLFNHLRKSRYDIIHSHSSNILFNCVLWLNSSPKVFTEHGGGLMGGESKYYLVYKIFHRNYCQVIAISKASAEDIKMVNALIAPKTRVVYNGLDIAAINAKSRDDNMGLPEEVTNAKFRVGIVARLVPQKGVSMFLEVAALLAKSKTDIVFVIVGDGPLKDELSDKSKELGVENKVFFLGFRQDAKRILKLFDVFLFTSEWEPFGLVIIEAMALGVPVVALNQKGAVTEIIRNGVDGFVIDQADPGILAEFVTKILDNPRRRKELIRNAYERVKQQFTIEQNAQQVIKIYKECMRD